jgi:IS30 family transposase
MKLLHIITGMDDGGAYRPITHDPDDAHYGISRPSQKSSATPHCRYAAWADRPQKTQPLSSHDACWAYVRVRQLRFQLRRVRKLSTDAVFFDAVHHFLLEHWSPAQITGTLRRMWPDDPSRTVSHETISNCVYDMPRGELRRELMACLRHAHSKRMPRSRRQNRRDQLSEVLSIHMRPPGANDRAFPGHWEGDVLKGAYNRSAVGVLLERNSRLACWPSSKTPEPPRPMR